jgi:putative heme-binding domain-containing protein
MTRGGSFAVFALACVFTGLTWQPPAAQGEPPTELKWIWFDEGDPAQSAPAETRYFRKVWTMDRSVDEASLDITADNQFTVWFNGTLVGKGDTWQRVYNFDVKKHFVQGKNVLAVQAHNTEGPAGLLVKLNYVPTGISKTALVSDASWKASRTAAEGWQKPDFDDGKWTAAKSLGAYGKAGPWRGLAWDSGGNDRFIVPPGFKVVKAAENPKPDDPFSLVNMAFDARGRLLVSQENGPILLCTDPDAGGVLQKVRPYCELVTNCQGICWVDDALLLVGKGPQGPGLYRCRDTKGADKIDEAKLLLAFKGDMGEHGPHAVVQGPDGWLYVNNGNHSWARPEKLADNSPLRRWPDGQMGPDQGKPHTTEDVLLPRLNDASGHAADILAPGGTIWRLDKQGKNVSLVAAGFRNHFDFAFSRDGELFTFDSDMEWDEGLPWYRAVRVCHCPPGADFVWRTGAANTPNYYIDSLPPVYETGRGSPVGLEFYEHHVFPEKYRGCFFMADWSLGKIHACFLERDGAGYKAKVETFCSGNPMNITDLAVAPDGSLTFTMGGRGSQGGVYRIVYTGGDPHTDNKTGPESLLSLPQPLSAWGRAQADRIWEQMPAAQKNLTAFTLAADRDFKGPSETLIAAMLAQQNHGSAPDADSLLALLKHPSAEVRACAVWLLGVNGYAAGKQALEQALGDSDAFVRRRACEALIRAGVEPPVEVLWPLLGDKDKYIRTAARLVLQRIQPSKWTERLWKEDNYLLGWEGIIALCKTDQADPYSEQIFERLQVANIPNPAAVLDYLRTVQMALIHTSKRPPTVKSIAERCEVLLAYSDNSVQREAAILLTYFRKEGLTNTPAHAKLLENLRLAEGDHAQQIHFYYCLRLLHDGWTTEQKDMLLSWYDSTKSWTGGHSFPGFLENILRDARPIFTADDIGRTVARGVDMPLAAAALLRMADAKNLPAPRVLGTCYEQLANLPGSAHRDALKTALLMSLGQCSSPEVPAILRQVADNDPAQRDTVARALARFPDKDNWPYLVRGLESPNKLVVFDVLEALRKSDIQPKPEDAGAYRSLLLASKQLDAANRWKAVQLLRHWSNDKRFGAEDGDWKTELAAWSRWYAQTFPKELALPDVASNKPAESKYKYDDLLAFLEKDPAGQKGDVERGKAVFTKAQCIKCHKYGKEGEGIGPDLSTVSKRFKRQDILESIYYPSKVISDQYRSSVIVTKKGVQFTGLAAPVGDTVTVLQNDGTKVTLKKDEIDQQFASLTSVMPELLLDLLSKEEIADLFAYLESEPR